MCIFFIYLFTLFPHVCVPDIFISTIIYVTQLIMNYLHMNGFDFFLKQVYLNSCY